MKTPKKSLATKALIDLIVIHQQLIRFSELHADFDWNQLEMEMDVVRLQQSLEMHLDTLNAIILSHPYWES